MPIINLADIQQITKNQQQLLFPHQKHHQNHSASNSIIADNFQLVMKQLFLQLPIQPFLNDHPQIAQLVNQVQELAPELFHPRKKLLVDNAIIAPLTVNNENYFIQSITNIAFKRGIPRIYEWAVRYPKVSWQDRIKLWNTTIQYAVIPNQMQLVILALDPVKPAQRLNICWHKKYHRQTEKWLIKLLNQPQENDAQSNKINQDISSLVNLNDISEVSI
ncbi:hypothetical protein B6N60_04927 [Richelia sinica FACHB-800]|uniref:Uncharacterized protein n=1 Tax=Richelia sinica FACHB-800 TaxID=1357546 RepID=A0A975TCB7_9NOST|nr:hypothetical protein [Richelia sinica]MBD2666925.1 hypothetical protein [Richelia sinica FACHB-800]QXE26196.1 hypothetical protein B6N60_04927 [Richelia sinica FACHB-800]